MGVKLPVPLAPFQELDIQDGSITIDVNAKQIVIPTDNQYLLPSFNQWTLNPNRCNLEETTCGGLKNSIVQDSFPGSLSIEGDGCYLQNLAGTYTGKSIGAGKLSETSDIINTGDTGLEIATADGVILRMGDGLPFLLRPPSAIVEQFTVRNISNDSQTYTINLLCTDSISSIELYNITNGTKESVTFAKTTNGYSFSKTIDHNYSESFQITAIYTDLVFTQSFTNDANQTIGLQNMSESWIALIPIDKPEINVFRFSDRPKQLEFKQNENGIITEVTLYPENGSIYHSQVTHSDISRISGTGYIPDSLNVDIVGSIPKFIKSYGMDTRFSPDVTLTTWVVPAISDTKILPLSEISDDFLGDEINLRMCPGEYGCASFVLQSNKDITVYIQTSDMICGESKISYENIDVKIVKCWIQGGNNNTGVQQQREKYLTPELLLHNDFLIQSNNDWNSTTTPIQGGTNYLLLRNGNLIKITTDNYNVNNDIITPISAMDFVDDSTIQPTILKSGYKKQFWITVETPSTAAPGNYLGTIYIISNGVKISQLAVNVEVLPISLLNPSLEYSIFYRGKLSDLGSISSELKTETQLTNELLNLKSHGISNPTLYAQSSNTTLIRVLNIRDQCGISNNTIYYKSLTINSSVSDISTFAQILYAQGVTQLYVYGIDEQSLDTPDLRAKITTIQNMGIKIFCAEVDSDKILSIADALNMVIAGSPPSTTYSDAYHSHTDPYYGHINRIFSYNTPQAIPEYPRVFRHKYGLLLWQMNYDGAMNYAYQKSMGDIYDDLDNPAFRDHVFAYPTTDGVIDTIQWEGFREAVNDIRYLTTLQAAITAHPGTTATTADNWLTTLKTTDLTTVDLDATRSQMIDYILELQSL